MQQGNYKQTEGTMICGQSSQVEMWYYPLNLCHQINNLHWSLIYATIRKLKRAPEPTEWLQAEQQH